MRLNKTVAGSFLFCAWLVPVVGQTTPQGSAGSTIIGTISQMIAGPIPALNLNFVGDIRLQNQSGLICPVDVTFSGENQFSVNGIPRFRTVSTTLQPFSFATIQLTSTSGNLARAGAVARSPNPQCVKVVSVAGGFQVGPLNTSAGVGPGGVGPSTVSEVVASTSVTLENNQCVSFPQSPDLLGGTSWFIFRHRTSTSIELVPATLMFTLFNEDGSSVGNATVDSDGSFAARTQSVLYNLPAPTGEALAEEICVRDLPEGAFASLSNNSFTPSGQDIAPNPGDVFGPETNSPVGLSLQGGRFSASLQVGGIGVAGDSGVAGGPVSVASAIPGSLGEGDEGAFFIFDENNPNMMVKVIDGCAINDRFWVAAVSNSTEAQHLTVTDSQTRETQTYQNQLGQPFQPVLDTQAFATCP